MTEALDQGELFAAELLAGGFTQPRHAFESAPFGGGRSGVAPADSGLRRGWRPLCSVVCNGLRGDFLGGHGREMFIQAEGGRVMTGSQFERAAGRELSKKWKESIHVVGEGEGSRATLLSWLRRRAERDFGTGAVGRQVWVCRWADGEYCRGTIVSYSREKGKHNVQYGSRLMEELHLPVELLSFDAAKPPAAAVALPAVGEAVATQQQLHRPLPAASAPALLNSADAPLPRPLWHQSSDISVRSSYPDEALAVPLAARTPPGAKGLRSGSRRPRKLVRAAEDAAADLPPPKRTASAPAAVLLAEVAAAVETGQVSDEVGGALPHSPQSALPPPVQRRRPLSEGKLPPPPEAPMLMDAQSQAAAMAWMHAVALGLEPELEELQTKMNSIATAGSGAFFSASGRFQALLALARHDRGWVQGFAEAMEARYRHFAGNPELQNRKMAEFVLAALHETALQHDMQALLGVGAAQPLAASLSS